MTKKAIAKLVISEAKLQEIRIIWMNTIILSILMLQIHPFFLDWCVEQLPIQKITFSDMSRA